MDNGPGPSKHHPTEAIGTANESQVSLTDVEVSLHHSASERARNPAYLLRGLMLLL